MHLRRFSRLYARFADAKQPTKASLPALNYDYSELEPVISKAQLELHHKKHHQNYVNNLNSAVEQFQEAQARHDYNKMAELSDKIKFNLGGHINHSIFWENLAPIGKGGGEFPTEESPFTQQVLKQFTSYENLINEFTQKTVPIQGSGWGWLAYDAHSKALRVMELPNQEMLAPKGLTPLLSKTYL